MFDSPARIVIRNVSADFCAVAGEAPGPSSPAARTAAPNLNCAPPDGVDEVVLADDALSVAHQIIEEVEYLWRDSDDVRSMMQFTPVGVECIVLEDIAHAAIPLGWPPIVEALASVATKN